MNVPLFLESLLILVQGMVGVFVVMANRHRHYAAQ